MQAKGGEDMGTAYNRAYLASVLYTYAQILLRRTSDTLVTLSEIVDFGGKTNKRRVFVYEYE